MGEVIGAFRADFLVEEQVVVEIKATEKLSEHDEAQLLERNRCPDWTAPEFGGPILEKKRRIF